MFLATIAAALISSCVPPALRIIFSMLETPTLMSPNLSGSRTNSPNAVATPGLANIPKAFLVCGLVAILYTALASLI